MSRRRSSIKAKRQRCVVRDELSNDLMIFSKSLQQGLMILCYLNSNRGLGPKSVGAIAAELVIHQEQAAKVLQALNKADFVSSQRGRNGGYTINCQLAQVPVLEVLDCLSGSSREHEITPQNCPHSPKHLCSAHKGMLKVHQQIHSALKGITLETLEGSICILVEQTQMRLRSEGKTSPTQLTDHQKAT